MTRITCDCQSCERFAARLRKPFPLQADVAEKLANADTHKMLMHAHVDDAIGHQMRASGNIRPA